MLVDQTPGDINVVHVIFLRKFGTTMAIYHDSRRALTGTGNVILLLPKPRGREYLGIYYIREVTDRSYDVNLLY
jgi:hypothetical protein